MFKFFPLSLWSSTEHLPIWSWATFSPIVGHRDEMVVPYMWKNSCLAESKSFKAVLLPVSSIWNLTSKLMALFSSCLNPSWSILLVRMTRCLVLIFTMSMKSISKSISLMTLVFAIVSKQVEVVNASRMFSSLSNFNNLLTLLNLRVTWPGATGDRRT